MSAGTFAQPRVITQPAPPQATPAVAPIARSLAEVYEANFQYVFRCLRSLGVRSDLLDDALQDVFIVVQDKLAYFDGRCQLRTWLYAIGLRVARRYRARAAREHRQDDVEQLCCAGDADWSLEQRERWALAQRALAALDDDKREVFVLAHVEQMSAPEIAEIIGLPVNTVYSRLRAARSAFQAQAARLRARGGRP
jgi:RNA polymerase sigma-70 factor (ECF subfamily)